MWRCRQRRRLQCPECTFSTAACYDAQAGVLALAEHTDMGRWKVLVRAGLRRLACPRPTGSGSRPSRSPAPLGFSRDFEDLIAFLATKTGTTTMVRLSRVDWDSVGRNLRTRRRRRPGPGRLDGLMNIGVDEVSWGQAGYLTLVTDHTAKKKEWVWGAEGEDHLLDASCDDFDETRSAALQATAWTWAQRSWKTAPG